MQPSSTRRRYIEETNVLETTFITEHGNFRVTDFMPLDPAPDSVRILQPMRELLRIIEATDGEPEVEVIYEPRPDYARVRPRLQRRGRLGWSFRHKDELVLLHTDTDLEPSGDGASLRGRVRMTGGKKHYLSLSYAKAEVAVVAPIGQEADHKLARTLDSTA